MDHLFGISFAQSGRARIGAAVAKGMDLRAFGTSAMGISKVFLRHIRHFIISRDQDLASGSHFSAGHAQPGDGGAMPTPLSTHVCSRYICYIVALIL